MKAANTTSLFHSTRNEYGLAIAISFRSFVAKHNISLRELPVREQFLHELNDCLGEPDSADYGWEYIRARVRFSSTSKCYNFHQCRLEPKYAECVNVANEWGSVEESRPEAEGNEERLSQLSYYYLIRSEFKASEMCTF